MRRKKYIDRKIFEEKKRTLVETLVSTFNNKYHLRTTNYEYLVNITQFVIY